MRRLLPVLLVLAAVGACAHVARSAKPGAGMAPECMPVYGACVLFEGSMRASMPQVREAFEHAAALWKTDPWALRGWTLSTIVTLRSGQGMTITSGTDVNLDGNNTDRPNLVGDPSLSHGRSRDELIAAWFNTAAFVAAAPGLDGNASRNFLDGPGSRNVDIGLFRDFKLKGDVTLQIRAEATNALNIVNLNNPGTSLNAPATFGKISGAGDMRELQLGMRLSF